MVMRECRKAYVPAVLLTLYGASPDRKLLGGTRALERPRPSHSTRCQTYARALHSARRLHPSLLCASAILKDFLLWIKDNLGPWGLWALA
ncbi:hypothetical protein GUJ93_ZPchr0251g33407 [Zizania palustris]|uniref:Uncharacterized protein n=1 Tax=Zizania palustris TaxID=103762 RepID=A0A8J5VEK4_ZIZPA|nr:hypothetical protein GUJ93_ZPchr0251g33407 [Zizania palustris]